MKILIALVFASTVMATAACRPIGPISLNDKTSTNDAPSNFADVCSVDFVNLRLLRIPSARVFERMGELPPGQYDVNTSDQAPYPSSEKRLPKNIVVDQREIWTSAFKLKPFDALWLAPAAALTGTAIYTDLRSSHYLRSSDPKTWQSYSNYGILGMAGLAGSTYLLGAFTRDEHLHEAGLLSGEASLDSFAVGELLKYATGRQRPDSSNPGDFFAGGDSFPSGHAYLSWSVASVLAHEYPSWFTQISVYGLAGFTSFARVRGEKHFVSDALVGSGLGWLIGREIYNLHHDPALGGAEVTHWKMPKWNRISNADEDRTPDNMGSTYVPIDSWVYQVFDRLIALGYVRSNFLAQRPWTRLECARLVQEGADNLQEQDYVGAGGPSSNSEGSKMIKVLQTEFREDLAKRGGLSNIGAAVESLYARATDITGPPLTDSFHFGQTVVDDYGRPYSTGFSSIAGASGRATAGPFAIYARAEFQSALSIAAEPLVARNAIASADLLPITSPSAGTPSIRRARLLEGYAAVNLHNFQFSFGKQSLWWGPNKGESMAFSNNAEPMIMFRIDRVQPIQLPWIFGLLGLMRIQFFIGQQSGIRFVGPFGDYNRFLNPQPYIHGEKISFKPTANLEFSVSRTTVFAGEHSPLTLHHFLVSLFGNGTSENRARLGVEDPGDRRSFVDFTYRVPGLRRWLTLYTDAFTDDEISPIAYPRKAAFSPGIYIPQFPKLTKLDFRMEGSYTPSVSRGAFPGFFYFNVTYKNGYTNNSNLIGSWIGREATGLQLWSTYSFTPKNILQAYYRRATVPKEFLAGGNLHDYALRSNIELNSHLSLSASVQYEHWDFTLLAPIPKNNLCTSVGMTFWPSRLKQ